MIASKLDTEGGLLGEMMVQLLRRAGLPVQPRLLLGPTRILREAMLEGQIDLYPEYTGNGALFHDDRSNPAWHQPGPGWQRARALDAPLGITWLAPAPADNTWVIAVRRELAAAGLTTLDGLAGWLAQDRAFKLACSAEFVDSPAALPAFQSAYGFRLPEARLLTLAGGDTAATIRAAAEAISGVNAAMAYGTDGALRTLGLLALADPRGAQIVYQPCPVIRSAALARAPQIAALLQPVFASLSLSALQGLNARIAVDGEDASAVAADWLRRLG